MIFAETRTNKFNVALTADGSTTPFRWGGGVGTFSTTGTFGAGSITLETSDAISGPWFEVDGAGSGTTFTSNFAANFTLAETYFLRATLTGATAPDLNVIIVENKQ